MAGFVFEMSFVYGYDENITLLIRHNSLWKPSIHFLLILHLNPD